MIQICGGRKDPPHAPTPPLLPQVYRQSTRFRKNAIQRALPLIRRVHFEDGLIGIDDVRTQAGTRRVAARSWSSASDEASQLLTVIYLDRRRRRALIDD